MKTNSNGTAQGGPYRDVRRALAVCGLLPIDLGELSNAEVVQFLDEWHSQALARPTPAEEAFWAERQAMRLGVGIDDEGYLVFAAPGVSDM